MAHNNLGILLSDLGKLEDAAASYRRSLELDPEYAASHNNLGGVLADLENLDEAAAKYRRSLELDPEVAVTHNNLGRPSKAGKAG